MRAVRPALSGVFRTRYCSRSFLLPTILHSTAFTGQRQPRRSFHVGPAVGAALQGTQELIVSFHELTHMPWFITIPLTALGISALFRLPFSIYAQNIRQRRATLTPILQAWNARIQRDVDSEGVPSARREREARTRLNKTTKRIWKRFGLQDWKMFVNVLGLPFWLLGIDSVRRLCGGPRGILGRWIFGAGGADASAAVPSETEGLADSIIQTAVEPSLTTGGTLWFPDLTVADPWHILPFALSAILVANLWPSTDAGRRALLNLGPRSQQSSAADPAKLRTSARVALRLQRSMLPVPLLIGPLTMDLPAALHLYWIASASASWATTKILKRVCPSSGNAIAPCKGSELFVIRPKRSADRADAATMNTVINTPPRGTHV